MSAGPRLSPGASLRREEHVGLARELRALEARLQAIGQRLDAAYDGRFRLGGVVKGIRDQVALLRVKLAELSPNAAIYLEQEEP